MFDHVWSNIMHISSGANIWTFFAQFHQSGHWFSSSSRNRNPPFRLKQQGVPLCFSPQSAPPTLPGSTPRHNPEISCDAVIFGDSVTPEKSIEEIQMNRLKNSFFQVAPEHRGSPSIPHRAPLPGTVWWSPWPNVTEHRWKRTAGISLIMFDTSEM